MTNSVVLEPMCVPPRRERNRRGAHPSAEGLCCVSIHAARARSLRTRRDGSGPKRFGRVLFFSRARRRRDETKHPRTCLSRRREGGTRACRTSKRASPRFRVRDFLPSRRVRRRPARKKSLRFATFTPWRGPRRQTVRACPPGRPSRPRGARRWPSCCRAAR